MHYGARVAIPTATAVARAWLSRAPARSPSPGERLIGIGTLPDGLLCSRAPDPYVPGSTDLFIRMPIVRSLRKAAQGRPLPLANA